MCTTLRTEGGAALWCGMREQPQPRTDAPIRDPYTEIAAPKRRVGWLLPLALLLLAGVLAGIALITREWLTPPPASVVTVRPGAAILIAARDLARLETAQVHVEKVIDLSDRQSRFFGLVEAEDAILLVAAGDATLGVDLAKLGEDDVTMDPVTKTARLRLPAPEVLQVGLDEQGTYVFQRTTSTFARRNEQLESRARREAVEAIKKVAMGPDMMGRAKVQAERQLRALVSHLGAEKVEITWRE